MRLEDEHIVESVPLPPEKGAYYYPNPAKGAPWCMAGAFPPADLIRGVSPNGTTRYHTERRGRSKSVLTKQHPKTKWRPPTPYWGYRYVTSTAGIADAVASHSTSSKNLTSMGWGRTGWMTKSLPTGIDLVTFRPFFASLQEQAITDALADLGAATAELGVELKERQKTANFIADQITTIVDCFKTIRRGDVPKAWRRFRRRKGKDLGSWAAKTLPEKWLEYRYAWTPMLLGIYDACALLENDRSDLVQTVRKRATTGSWTETTGGGQIGRCRLNHTREQGQIDSVYVVMTFVAKRDFLVHMNSAGVVNPASVWWETVPLSFVADWFVNVGDYINAQMALQLWSLKGGTATHRREWRDYTRFKVVKPDDDFHLCFAPFISPRELGGSSFNRIVLEGVSPSLIADLNPLNLTRLTDAVALASGAFRSKTHRI